MKYFKIEVYLEVDEDRYSIHDILDTIIIDFPDSEQIAYDSKIVNISVSETVKLTK